MAPLTIAWIALAVVARVVAAHEDRRLAQDAFLRRQRQVASCHAADVDVEPLQPARIGDRLAFGAAHQHGVGARRGEKAGEQGRVFRMGVIDDAQRPRAGARGEQLGDGVAGVAQADDVAHREQARQRRA